MFIGKITEQNGNRALSIPKEIAPEETEFIIQKYDNCYFFRACW